eukprot:m.55935 g.55935  ORF g.55935 m.55935 type:complete len:379 (+) comp22157_c0_seq1:91-1227(+)
MIRLGYLVGASRYQLVISSGSINVVAVAIARRSRPNIKHARIRLLQQRHLASISSEPLRAFGVGKQIAVGVTALITAAVYWNFRSSNDNKSTLDSMPPSAKDMLVRAQRQIIDGDLVAATSLFREAEALLKLLSPESEAVVTTQLRIANLEYSQHNWENAVKYFKLVTQGWVQSGREMETEPMIEVSLKVADCYANNGQHTEARAGFLWCVATARQNLKNGGKEEQKEEAENLDKRKNSLALCGMACDALAKHMLDAADDLDIQGAIELRKEALEIAIKIDPDNTTQVATAHSNVSTAYYTAGDLEHAREHASSALEMASKSADKSHLHVFQTNLALLETDETTSMALLSLALQGAKHNDPADVTYIQFVIDQRRPKF